jgi:starch-binding outer membrane protein, SusD/RagB family
MRLFTPALPIAVGCSLLLVGCDLNLEPPTEVRTDAIWSDAGLVEAYLSDVYSRVGYGFGDPMIAGLADEAKNTHGHGDAPMLLSNMTATDRGLWQWNNEEVITQFRWDLVYASIRDLNTIIQNVEPSQAIPADKKTAFLGEAYFLRAFFYHNLMRLHGGVPLVDQVYELGSDLEQYQVPRGSFEQTVNFIVADLDAAASRLTANGRRLGAATQGAALALKCRVLLYAASDLYARPSGIAETRYTGGDRTARWQAAANACKAVMDLGRYSLAPAPTSQAYHDLFTKGNPTETIWARYFQTAGGETHDQGRWVSPNGYNAWSGDTPLQEHVDAYEMSDGSEFSWANPAHAADPYANRDPRFYANILYNGAVWRPRGSNLAGQDPVGVIQTGWFEMPGQSALRPGLDTREGPVEIWNGTKTGYNLAKFVDKDLLPGLQQQFNPWPFLRYAEVLLNYAEAAAELGLTTEAADALNQVRARVGMPAVLVGAPGRTLIERIRQEREVELAFEEHRYFDIRRWMIAPQLYTSCVVDRRTTTCGHGIRVTGRLDPAGKPLNYSGQEYRYRYEYEVIQVDERVWNDRAYFLPIPQDEMDRNPKLVQNPLY